jgi:hypothetical protein
MKLDRLTSARLVSSLASRLVTSAIVAALASTATFASGCSATTAQAPQTATGASLANGSVAGTTSLMSAELAAPAPRVGKSHLAVDDAADFDVDTMNSESAPKEARRSDGSHRSGSFGMSSK